MRTKLFLAGVALIALTAAAAGQEAGTNNNRPLRQHQSAGFRDDNRNGICDNFENRKPGYPDCNGTGRHRHGNQCSNKGVGRGQGKNQGNQGRNFTDENKNGVCDRNEAAPVK